MYHLKKNEGYPVSTSLSVTVAIKPVSFLMTCHDQEITPGGPTTYLWVREEISKPYLTEFSDSGRKICICLKVVGRAYALSYKLVLFLKDIEAADICESLRI